MNETYRVTVIEGDGDEDRQYVMEGLNAYNRAYTAEDYQPLQVLAFAPDGQRAGGLLGETFWGWLHVGWLWLEEWARGQGLGSRLLAAAEEEGRRRGAHSVFLDTMDFQARPFYERHGYTVYATMEDMPPGHTRYSLRKRL